MTDDRYLRRLDRQGFPSELQTYLSGLAREPNSSTVGILLIPTGMVGTRD